MSSGAQPDSFGPLTGAVTIGFQRGEAVVANEGAIDFDDSPTIAWTLTDDPAGARVKVAAVVQGLTAAMVAGAADLTSPNDQRFAGAIWAGEAVALASDGSVYFGPGDGTLDVQLRRTGNATLALTQAGGGVGALIIGGGIQSSYLSPGGTGGLQICNPGIGSNAPKISFFGAAPVSLQGAAQAHGSWTIGSLAAVTIDSRTSGGSGGSFYTVQDIVAALKAYGLLAQ